MPLKFGKTLPNILKCSQNIQTQIESSKQFWLTFQCFAICAEYCTLETERCPMDCILVHALISASVLTVSQQIICGL
jgi:hypothetical protein